MVPTGTHRPVGGTHTRKPAGTHRPAGGTPRLMGGTLGYLQTRVVLMYVFNVCIMSFCHLLVCLSVFKEWCLYEFKEIQLVPWVLTAIRGLGPKFIFVI